MIPSYRSLETIRAILCRQPLRARPIGNQPTGRYAREKTGASYLAQYTRAAHLHAALINGVAQLHHVIGIAYSDDSVSHLIGPSGTGGDYSLSDSYTRLDIDSG